MRREAPSYKGVIVAAIAPTIARTGGEILRSVAGRPGGTGTREKHPATPLRMTAWSWSPD